jgi:hypothetical protein
VRSGKLLVAGSILDLDSFIKISFIEAPFVGRLKEELMEAQAL